MKILAIDPSTTACGWAFGTRGKLYGYGVAKGDAMKDPLYRMSSIVSDIVQATQAHVVTHLIMEEPSVWQTARGSKASASGALNQLSLGAGYLYGALIAELGPKTYSTVTPQKWKGQFPKDLMFQKMVKKYGVKNLKPTEINYNITDAIGIMDWWLEKGPQG